MAAACRGAGESSPEPKREPAASPSASGASPATANAGSEPGASAKDQPPPAAAPAAAPAANSGSPAASRVLLALAKYLSRAELRRGSAQLFDFGVPGDAKYTTGGWLTFTGDPRKFGEVRASFIRGQNWKVSLPADAVTQDRLTLRVRSFRSAPLTVYVNGKTIADRKLGGKDFETFVLALAPELLHAGENQLELRVQAGDGPSSGFALDFLELASHDAPEASAPPSSAELTANDAPDTVRVPNGIALGYTLEVPEAATLEGQLRTTGSAKLHVIAQRDGKPALELAQLEAGSEAKPFRVELGPLAGEIARIDLRAESGDVELVGANVRVATTTPPPSAAEAKPVKNVIVMLVDTLRADKLTPYNDKTRVRTPNLSRFLRSAAVMLDARSQENWTKPSVATLLSSLYPWQHTAYTENARLPDDVEILPERLRKRGFFTGAFIANGYVSDKFGFQQGWDTYRNYIREGRPSVAQYVAADVLQWLDKRPKDKPFFLYVHTIDPHVPYIPPKMFLSLYDPAPYDGIVDFNGNGELLESIKIGRAKLNDRDREHLVALYDGEISYHDAHFGTLLDALEKRGLTDDTMVVLTADHGEEFWDHGSVGHGHSIYDELLHIPMIVRLPGVTEGKPQVAADVGLVDVVPTIFEALGLPVPSDVSGSSFLSALRGGGDDAPRATVSGFMTGWRTLAVGSLKLVQRGIGNSQLFDVKRDRGETENIAAKCPIALRYTRALLGLTLSGRVHGTTPSELRTHKQQTTAIDSKTEAQLRALGYVGSSKH